MTDPSSTEVVQEDLSPGKDCADEQEANFEDVLTTLILDNTDDLTQVEYDLPIQQRCAAHTMNLVASSNITKSLSSSREALSRTVYKRSSFAKCSALWSKASRSTLASDDVEATLKRKLIVPTPTRWNSNYENLSADLDEICAKLNLRCLSERELSFLKNTAKYYSHLQQAFASFKVKRNVSMECFFQL